MITCGISPDGAITFVSSLFPGCISDKALTRTSGILDLLDSGNSVMADRGRPHVDVRGKKQLSERAIVTRRIASLRIHVERAMYPRESQEFTRTDIADRIFFVCCTCSI